MLLILASVLVIVQVVLICGYTDAAYLPAVVDGLGTVGWLAIGAYLIWFVIDFIPLLQTKIFVVIAGTLLWLAGSWMICDIMVRIVGVSYISFAPTIPFRLLFGIPVLVGIILWYCLIIQKEENLQNPEQEYVVKQELPAEPQTETIDRITVKDGSRIHLIKTDELLYIQACGDYVTLNTASDEYVKEQTMKYFETQLPPEIFVRIHRSTIVNVTQISRIELFGKETYMLLLKNGTKLRASFAGYRLLKERLGL